ncbi:MAG: DUF1566 domain-containing protein, partial [Candidatus Tenebribacter davisii]|nr:DUF1566 domain-containing protein [Candidatus Tenebribacter davisii]
MKKIIVLLTALSLLFTIVSCSETTSNNNNGNDPGTSYDYTLVETGQVECYNSDGEVIDVPIEGEPFFGQDANYLSGANFLYVDNDDETVTDTNTGLMWQKIPDSDGFSYQDAVEYCENLELAGYNDWRVPSLKE